MRPKLGEKTEKRKPGFTVADTGELWDLKKLQMWSQIQVTSSLKRESAPIFKKGAKDLLRLKSILQKEKMTKEKVRKKP